MGSVTAVVKGAHLVAGDVQAQHCLSGNDLRSGQEGESQQLSESKVMVTLRASIFLAKAEYVQWRWKRNRASHALLRL